MLHVKRTYDDVSRKDGVRILASGRAGFSKREAMIDCWMKDIVPSTELRKWCNQDSGRWREFKRRYFRGLREDREELVEELTRMATNKTVTLILGQGSRHGLALRQPQV